MKRVLSYLLLLFLISHSSFLISCVDEVEHDNTPTGNFEALWQIIDEHYCFFDYKQHEYGLDWQEVYNKYKVRVSNKMNTQQLFEVLSEHIAEYFEELLGIRSTLRYAR